MAPLEPLFMAFNGPYSQHQQGGDDKNHIADGVPYKHVQRRQKIITFKKKTFISSTVMVNKLFTCTFIKSSINM